jgi:hypothetical protein
MDRAVSIRVESTRGTAFSETFRFTDEHMPVNRTPPRHIRHLSAGQAQKERLERHDNSGAGRKDDRH